MSELMGRMREIAQDALSVYALALNVEPSTFSTQDGVPMLGLSRRAEEWGWSQATDEAKDAAADGLTGLDHEQRAATLRTRLRRHPELRDFIDGKNRAPAVRQPPADRSQVAPPQGQAATTSNETVPAAGPGGWFDSLSTTEKGTLAAVALGGLVLLAKK